MPRIYVLTNILQSKKSTWLHFSTVSILVKQTKQLFSTVSSSHLEVTHKILFISYGYITRFSHVIGAVEPLDEVTTLWYCEYCRRNAVNSYYVSYNIIIWCIYYINIFIISLYYVSYVREKKICVKLKMDIYLLNI